MKRSLLGLGLLAVAFPAFLIAHDQLDNQGPKPAPSVSLLNGGNIPFTSSNVSLLGWIPLASLDAAATSGNDCWGYTSGSGREYAIIGTSAGTNFVEISDPGAPVIISTIPGVTSLWRDIKVYQNHAYAVSEGGGGIQVFDMSAIDTGVVTNLGNIGNSCQTQSHNVVIDEDSGFLYRVGVHGGSCPNGASGMLIYDLSNPSVPVEVGSWNTRYVHDAQVITWPVAGPFFGRQIAFCAANTSSGGGTPSLFILDVTNKSSISIIGTTTYPGSAFSHQLWVADDFQHVYLNDELDESNFGTQTMTRILNISDLTSPTPAGQFTTGTDSIDHNLYVKGDLIFEANYRSGVRIFDNSNPTAPVQIGFYDTYPADDDAQFNSLWSVYPYFDSGTFIGSDLEQGLFIWRMGPAELAFDFPNGQPALVNPSGDTLMIDLIEAGASLDPSSVVFHVDSGSGVVDIPLTLIPGSTSVAAPFPASACGTNVTYTVSAKTVAGTTWSSPAAGGTQVFSATSALLSNEVFSDNIESITGWTAGAAGDTATTGLWTRGNPNGTAAQPEDDHTEDPGSNCFFTGQGSVGGSVGQNDVDGGITTLFSPIIDASGLSMPTLSYWRWFSNNGGGNPGEDTLTVDISNNGGSSWTALETVGPTGAETTGGWIRHQVLIEDFVAPTANMRLRFITGDLGGGSIVEAAIDDIQILDLVCDITLTGLTPKTGSRRGGTVVYITGEGYVSGATTVMFGDQPADKVTVVSPNRLRVHTPALKGSGRRAQLRRSVDVTVTTGPGSATRVKGFTYTGGL